MSCTFHAGDDSLWSASNTVARLFTGQAAAVATEFGLSSGIGEIVEDECAIELPALEAFLAELAARYADATHPILRSLLVPVLGATSVLVERAGGRLPPVDPMRAADWAAMRTTYARAMPR